MSDTDTSAAQAPRAAAALRGGKLALLALTMSLAVAGATYFWARFVAEPGTAMLRASVDDLGAERDAQAHRISATDARLAELATAQSAAEITLDTLQKQTANLEGVMKALAARGGDQSLDWVLAETEYLVLAASQRLTLAEDVGSAQAALNAADERLRSAEHPTVARLREQLARDLQALGAVAVPDIAGLSLKFAAQIRKVDQLHTKPIAEVDTSFKHSREQRVTGDNWRDVLQAMWDDLMGLIEIKDDKLPDGVLFDPKLRALVEQNLKLELSSARLAILARDTTNFRVAVEIVQDALARYYDDSDAAVKALAAMLSEVRGTELAPALPNVSATLDAVRAARQALRSPPAVLPTADLPPPVAESATPEAPASP